ncbi:hypothetical protein CN582_25235 [Bacillus wiedmannii]|uniref:aminoglycoside phosphotransferase family protein n=1 Tax=Bacillus wiedmannii TaxID=1890302 RepID=UPI000BF7844B|nr:aminoglycoside phosphotransferase family protein [Bacillus wiedmannii]PEP92446.1 hypothetical protein CN582_25235 [Bacillus wiedmannii]
MRMDSLDIINLEGLSLAPGSYSNQTYTFVYKNKKYYVFINKYNDNRKVKRQLTMINLLENSNIPAPNVIKNPVIPYKNKDNEIIITEEIEGINLGELIMEDKIEVERAFYLMGKLLKEIHSAYSFRNFGYIESRNCKSWNGFLERLIGKWIYLLSNNNELLPLFKFERIQDYLYTLVKKIPHKRSSALLHGDYYPNNVIYNDSHKKIAGVVDFEWSMYGDPIYDFRVMEFFLFPKYIYKEFFYKGYNINIKEIEVELSIYREIYKLELAYMISLTDKDRLKEAKGYLEELYSQAENM